jgi:hypothetical protein
MKYLLFQKLPVCFKPVLRTNSLLAKNRLALKVEEEKHTGTCMCKHMNVEMHSVYMGKADDVTEPTTSHVGTHPFS